MRTIDVSEDVEENNLLNKNGNIVNSLNPIKVKPLVDAMPKLMSALDEIKQYTTIVADTGDFEGS